MGSWILALSSGLFGATIVGFVAPSVNRARKRKAALVSLKSTVRAYINILEKEWKDVLEWGEDEYESGVKRLICRDLRTFLEFKEYWLSEQHLIPLEAHFNNIDLFDPDLIEGLMELFSEAVLFVEKVNIIHGLVDILYERGGAESDNSTDVVEVVREEIKDIVLSLRGLMKKLEAIEQKIKPEKTRVGYFRDLFGLICLTVSKAFKRGKI